MKPKNQTARETVIKMLDALIDQKIVLKVSEWAEAQRYLPEELTPDPGFWRNDRTPYLVEPMDCLGPSSPINRVVVMKGTQGGWTTGLIENFIGYTIDHDPSSFLYISADQTMTEDSMEIKIDKMIDNIPGLREKIKPSINKRHNKATGDTKRKKDFPGGFLLAVGARSAGKLRSNTVRKLALDEVDGYPQEVGSEGDPINLAEQRTKNYGHTRKNLYISTPTILQTSRIARLYEEGDKREYYIPCPGCGQLQTLEFFPSEKKNNRGIHFLLTPQNRLIPDSVYYQCQFCDYHIKNHEKTSFLKKGQWIADEKHHPTDDRTRSYFWTPLLSPWHTWEQMVISYLSAKGDYLKYKSWWNTELGRPWEERGERPDTVQVNSHRRMYSSKTIPNKLAIKETGGKILVLTVAVDTHDKNLMYEIAGWTNHRNMFSIEQGMIEGDTSKDEVWDKLRKKLVDTRYRDENGIEYYVWWGAIDAGGHRTTEVLDHCRSYGDRFLVPIMGARYLTNELKIIVPWQQQNPKPGYPGLDVYSLNTTSYKNDLARKLRQTRDNNDNQPKGYYNYPEDYPQSYFDQFRAEEFIEEKDPRTGKTKALYWRQIGKRANHTFDLAVYNRFAIENLASVICESPNYLNLEKLDWLSFWEFAEKGSFYG